ncbi:hypothetical protein [Segetibacter koreensis]|uniref:hypothetical protein n=1 Tax=Segetibacter koreensis TaxID=398037 RepID=UPI00035D3478|nr:hypothetical protein [Segetibacter koreensis]
MQRVDISGLVLLMAIVSALSLAFIQHSGLLLAGYGVLIGIIALTWKQYLPNVFTFVMVFHWVQVITYVLFVNSAWQGDLDFLTHSSVRAYLSALAGIVVMCFVFNKVAYKNIHISALEFEEALNKINPRKVLYLYLVLYIISTFLSRLAFGFTSLTQIFLNIALLKWGGFVLLGYLSFRKKEYRIFFAIAFVLDFISGFFSYFSSFKEVFFYTAIVVMTYITAINFSVSVKGIAIALLLFSLAVVWTVVKGDYRNFLNEGSKQQIVTVSEKQAFGKLSDLLSIVNKETFTEGIGQFFYRLQYVYHLSRAMDNVPANEPFQHGAVWRETIAFTTVPRALDPDKGIYDASIKASRFTGIRYLSGAQGVSFSLGYFADCYVDFGIPGMFVALAILAFIWSKIFRFFLLKSTGNIVINYAIVAAFFVQFSFFEMDGTFMFGRMFTTFVVFTFLKYTLFPRMERFVCF